MLRCIKAFGGGPCCDSSERFFLAVLLLLFSSTGMRRSISTASKTASSSSNTANFLTPPLRFWLPLSFVLLLLLLLLLFLPLLLLHACGIKVSASLRDASGIGGPSSFKFACPRLPYLNDVRLFSLKPRLFGVAVMSQGWKWRLQIHGFLTWPIISPVVKSAFNVSW
jgi:hypothetical protein